MANRAERKFPTFSNDDSCAMTFGRLWTTLLGALALTHVARTTPVLDSTAAAALSAQSTPTTSLPPRYRVVVRRRPARVLSDPSLMTSHAEPKQENKPEQGLLSAIEAFAYLDVEPPEVQPERRRFRARRRREQSLINDDFDVFHQSDEASIDQKSTKDDKSGIDERILKDKSIIKSKPSDAVAQFEAEFGGMLMTVAGTAKYNYTLPFPQTFRQPRFPDIPQNDHRKLLVFDLDHTILEAVPWIKFAERPDHYGTSDHVVFLSDGALAIKLRPGILEFLAWCADRFELALWTAGKQFYADAVLDQVPNLKRFFPPHRRMYAQDCEGMIDHGVIVKNVRMLGVDLRRVILMDNNLDSFMLQTIYAHHEATKERFLVLTNGVYVLDFLAAALPLGHAQSYLIELNHLKKLLAFLSNQKVADVRPHLIEYQLRIGFPRQATDE